MCCMQTGKAETGYQKPKNNQASRSINCMQKFGAFIWDTYSIYSNYDTENIFDVMKIFLHLQSTRKKK